MKTPPEEIVAEAFALSNARGADLLVRLGAYRVWQGNLADMRGDDPRDLNPSNDPQETAPATDVFLDTLRLVRAIEKVKRL